MKKPNSLVFSDDHVLEAAAPISDGSELTVLSQNYGSSHGVKSQWRRESAGSGSAYPHPVEAPQS